MTAVGNAFGLPHSRSNCTLTAGQGPYNVGTTRPPVAFELTWEPKSREGTTHAHNPNDPASREAPSGQSSAGLAHPAFGALCPSRARAGRRPHPAGAPAYRPAHLETISKR